MPTHSPTKHTGSTTTGNTLDEARSEMKSEARSLAEDAKSAARDAAHTARETAQNKAEEAKHGVAREVGDVASALRKAAHASRHGSPQERTFGHVAEGLADISDAIADKDLGEMAEELGNFARRNPLAFLGGAALIGFAATRFAKAGHRPDQTASHETQPVGTPAIPARPTSAPVTPSYSSHNGGAS